MRVAIKSIKTSHLRMHSKANRLSEVKAMNLCDSNENTVSFIESFQHGKKTMIVTKYE